MSLVIVARVINTRIVAYKKQKERSKQCQIGVIIEFLYMEMKK